MSVLAFPFRFFTLVRIAIQFHKLLLLFASLQEQSRLKEKIHPERALWSTERCFISASCPFVPSCFLLYKVKVQEVYVQRACAQISWYFKTERIKLHVSYCTSLFPYHAVLLIVSFFILSSSVSLHLRYCPCYIGVFLVGGNRFFRPPDFRWRKINKQDWLHPWRNWRQQW